MGTAWFCFTKFIAPKELAVAQEKIACLAEARGLRDRERKATLLLTGISTSVPRLKVGRGSSQPRQGLRQSCA